MQDKPTKELLSELSNLEAKADYGRIQFLHQRTYKICGNHSKCEVEAKGGRTYALEVPTREELGKILEFEDPTLALAFGESRCHSEENYNRAVGRIYATARAVPTSFKVTNIQIEAEGRSVFLLQSKTGVRVYLQGKTGSNRLYLNEIS